MGDSDRALTLAQHYTRFAVANRLLLTGHSHQAWPDVAAVAMQAAFEDAAHYVDEKWEKAFEQADRVRAGFRRLLDDADGSITLMGNTHDAVVRFLSALPLAQRPHIVTTTSEFFTLRRQLDRLCEEGIAVTATPADAAQIIAALQPNTAAVMVSTVSYLTGQLLPDLRALHDACERNGTALFLDAYHHLNVAPFSLRGLERAFVTGGGYKYCQLGEGNCFLRVPKDCKLRPVITGWFAEFGHLETGAHGTPYADGHERFAGATYDPVSHYRGAAVFAFFEQQGLDVTTLRRISQAQTARIAQAVDALGLKREPAPHTEIAGFIAVQTPKAAELVAALRARGVHTDARGEVLRFGPAPYVSDAQIDTAMGHLAELVR